MTNCRKITTFLKRDEQFFLLFQKIENTLKGKYTQKKDFFKVKNITLLN